MKRPSIKFAHESQGNVNASNFSDIQRRLEAAGKDMLTGLTIKQAGRLIHVQYTLLAQYFWHNYLDFAKYNVLLPKSIAELLAYYGRNQLEGRNITEVARLLRVKQPALSVHFMRHPEEYNAYGIDCWDRDFVTNKLAKYGINAFSGLNLLELSEKIDISIVKLKHYFDDHPKRFVEFGLVHRKIPSPITDSIPDLLWKKRKLIKNKSVRKTSKIINISYTSLFNFFRDNPEYLEKYKIKKRDKVGRGQIRLLLREKGKYALMGKTINAAANLIGCSYGGLYGYIRNNPKERKKYGLQ